MIRQELKGGEAKALKPYLDRDRSTVLSCPKCGGATRVLDSRNGPQNTVRRRRGCCTSACLHRMTTYELIVENAPIVDIVQLAGKLATTIDGAKLLLDQAVDLVKAASLVSGINK